MMKLHSFVFNDFEENTYILYDEVIRQCIIIDPGNNGTAENGEMAAFIEGHQLQPIQLINTHCHIDHVLGNAWVQSKYGLYPVAHRGEIPVLASCERVAQMYGIPYIPSPPIADFLDEGNIVQLGDNKLEVLFCPGHSPASICLYWKEGKLLIAGDVLFHRSIGRTDLPGGDYDTLIESINSRLMVLPDDVEVYPGHGIPTTIGEERSFNPFLNP